jgi:hypothetical protein
MMGSVGVSVVMIVVMSVSSNLIFVDQDIKFRSADTGPETLADTKLVSSQRQKQQLPPNMLKVNTKIEQRADEHIPADSRKRLNVKDSTVRHRMRPAPKKTEQ